MKRFVLVALPTSATFGSLIPGVGSMFAFRLMILLLGLQALGSSKATPKGLRSVTTFRLMVALWTVVGLVGSFFAESIYSAMREFLPLFLGFFLAYTFIAFRDPSRVLKYVQTGWVVAFMITGVLAFREIVTGVHMSNYLAATDVAALHSSRLVASVFGNPNAYAAFLVTAFAFLVNGLLKSEAWYSRYSYVGLIMALFLLMLSTGSRLCLFALFLEGAFFAFYAGKRYWKSLASGVILVLLSLFFVGAGATDSLASRLPGKLATLAPSKMVHEVLSGESESSGSRRLGLYKNGLWMVGNSAGLGVGPGNFEVVMASGDAPYDAGGVIDPHNLYLEIASQYGLLVFVSFVLWIAACFRACWGAARRGIGVTRSWGIAMSAAVAGNAVSALANSSYLPGSINWVFLATLFLVAVTIERGAQNRTPSLTSPNCDASHPSSHSQTLDAGSMRY